MATYRAGIIGLGRIAVELPDNHLRAYLENGDIEVVAVADSDVKKLVKFTKYHTYTSYEEMAQREALDIISICTPVETHCEITCMVAPFTHALLVEKPIAPTLEDADKMIETCHKNNVILQINHQRAFTIPKFRFSRDIVDTGTHMFELLTRLFGKFEGRFGEYWCFGFTEIEIEYVHTDEHIFEFDCLHTKEPMINKSVAHLVSMLKGNTEHLCSGEDGKQSLRLALIFKEMYEKL